MARPGTVLYHRKLQFLNRSSQVCPEITFQQTGKTFSPPLTSPGHSLPFPAFCPGEEYAGADGKSSYGFSGGNARYLIGELSDKETILLDGYAVALLQDDLKDDEMEVTYRYFDPADGTEVRKKVRYARPGKGDDQTPELVSTTWKNSEGNEGRYYLAPLPEELVDPNAPKPFTIAR